VKKNNLLILEEQLQFPYSGIGICIFYIIKKVIEQFRFGWDFITVNEILTVGGIQIPKQ